MLLPLDVGPNLEEYELSIVPVLTGIDLYALTHSEWSQPVPCSHCVMESLLG